MERSVFRQVKTALALDPRPTLEALGVNLKHGIKGEWSQCICPFCGDKSGSASITQQGFLRCHQCSRKMDIFELIAELNGCSEYAAMQQLAERLNVDLAIVRHRGKPPREMTIERLRAATEALWVNKDAEPCRQFLKKRKIDCPQLLDQFGVGYLGGYLIFAQWDQTGRLRPRYRRYSPGGLAQQKWGWSPGRGGATGFWPYAPLPPKGPIWLMEGEFDVMTAWMVLRLQAQGITAFTWTGGAGAPIPAHMIPEQWRGKEVHILYDNDTFQGSVWEEYRAPDEKKKREMGMRHENLLKGIAASFQAQNCNVFLRAIPIDPLETWGGDFRDWVDGGGRDIADLKSFAFKNLAPKKDPPTESDLKGVFGLIGKEVKAIGEVNTIQQEGVGIYRFAKLDCDMNQLSCCVNCKGPLLFPGQLMDMAHHQTDLANAMVSRDPNAYLLKYVVGKPPACMRARIEPLEYDAGTKWTAVHDDPERRTAHELTVISKDEPSLSGEVEITGRVHHHRTGNSVILLADQLRQLDCAEVDLGPYINELVQLCPTEATTVEQIHTYLNRRCADLAYNVTHIYGRQAIHLAHDLLMHSTLTLPIDRQRGWVDICILGDTRTGKSKTFEALHRYHRLGTMHSCMQVVSKAGLIMAGTPTPDGYKIKPGLFPRCHKKALIMDEFHNMMKVNVIGDLQTARDVGQVHGAKAYGTRVMPAMVRFAAIANWPTDRQRFRFLCEHFLALYKVPECLSRTDFGLVVTGDPTESGPVEAAHEWTEELVRALILRAWAQDESMVHIQDQAMQLAYATIETWKGLCDTDLPLFTAEEKVLSLLRLAIAVANLCFSHPKGEFYHVEVRPCHVEWAAWWLKQTWKWNGYLDFSYLRKAKAELERPYDAERTLTVELNLEIPQDATNVLNEMLGGFTQSRASGFIGKEHYDTMKWISKLVRLGVVYQSRSTQNVHHTDVQLTKPGDTAVRNLIRIAENYPNEWKRRYRKLSDMAAGPLCSNPDMVAITAPELFHVISD